MKHFLRVFLILTASIVFLAAVCVSAYLIVTRSVKLDEKRLRATNTAVCVLDDKNSAVFSGNLSRSNNYTPIDNISERAIKAFVCVEDKTFYKHSGINLKRIFKAALNNIKSLSYAEGASTISQQLIKNTHLSNDKTISRKLKELRLTKKLEKAYSKDQILEMYLNTIYFGHSAFGIENASYFYFGKTPDRLNIPESATLAAIIKAPNNYSPFKNAEKCLQRRNLVLKMMLNDKLIDEDEYRAATATSLPQSPYVKQNAEDSFINRVFDELNEINEINIYSVSNGIKIYTYLDAQAQGSLYAQAKQNDIGSDVSVVLIDNKQCGVCGYYSTAGNIVRQPASIIKPLAVYAPAIDIGYICAATPLLDEKTDFGGYSPENYNGKYRGIISARDALAQSVNVPAVKILSGIGVTRAEDYLNGFGLKINESDKNLSLALGGLTDGFSLQQLTAAYCAFPNDGVYSPVKYIKKITTMDDTLLYDRQYTSNRVIMHSTSHIINSILSDTIATGTAKKLSNLPYELCAKTGTNGSELGNKDAYALSYTSRHTLGVWYGNTNNDYVNASGSGMPCELSRQIYEKLYTSFYPADFNRADDVISLNYDALAHKEGRLLLADDNAPKIYVSTDLFSKNNIPTEKSTVFSNIVIPKPKIAYADKCATINISGNPLYFVCVKRKQKGCENETVVYDGKLIDSLIDNNLAENTIYEYSVTPYYKFKNATTLGKQITLDKIYTAQNSNLPQQPEINRDIIKGKNWWLDD